jgi:hypothetical protein
MAQAMFILNNLLAACAGKMLGGLLVRTGSPWRRMLAMLGGFGVAVLMTVFVIGTLGCLTSEAAAAFLVCACMPGLPDSRGSPGGLRVRAGGPGSMDAMQTAADRRSAVQFWRPGASVGSGVDRESGRECTSETGPSPGST